MYYVDKSTKTFNEQNPIIEFLVQSEIPFLGDARAEETEQGSVQKRTTKGNTRMKLLINRCITKIERE